MFKKLFAIEYKNKKFLLLSAEDHRITFLEIDKKGNLLHPLLSDFKELNDIYNNYNRDICYDETVEDDKNVEYKEKVDWRGLLLTVITTLGMGGGIIHFMLRPNTRCLELINYTIAQPVEKERTNLSLYYEEKITAEDVIKVIQDNPNIPDNYKDIAIRVMYVNLRLDPNLDLRIYYENMKDLTVTIIPTNSLYSINQIDASAWFDSLKCEICVKEKYSNDETMVAHEFNHAMHTLYTHVEGTVIKYYEGFGSSLAEAMTNRIINNEFNRAYSYDLQQKVLDYLIKSADEFTYQTYNEYGITALFDELKEKYPDIDIDYIVEYMDAYTESLRHNIKTVAFKKYDYFMQEMIKLAAENAFTYSPYEELKKCLDLIGDFTDEEVENYFNQYNQLLEEKGLKRINSARLFQLSYSNTREMFKNMTEEEEKAFMDEVFEEMISYMNEDTIYRDFEEFEDILDETRHLRINGSRYEYLGRYDAEVVKRGYLTEEQVFQVRELAGMLKDGDDLYWIYKEDDFFDATRKYYNLVFFPRGGEYHTIAANEQGEKYDLVLNRPFVEFNRCITPEQSYILRLMIINPEKYGNIFTEEAKTALADIEFDPRNYNTLENGEVLFDKITPDMVVEIGLDENNEVGFVLKENDKVIYSTCDRFTSPTAQIPYNVYVRISEENGVIEYNSIESIFTKRYLDRVSLSLLEYLAPAIKVVPVYVTEPKEGYRTTYEFSEPYKLIVDGQEGSLRDVYAYIDFEKGDDIEEHVYVHLLNGENVYMGEYGALYHEEGYSLSDIFLQEIIEKQQIEANGDHAYIMTSEEIIDIYRHLFRVDQIEGAKSK